jgi:hypothetical protein
MNKKTNNNNQVPETNVHDRMQSGIKYLDTVRDEDLNSEQYIPEHVFGPLSDFVRGVRKTHDVLTEQLDKVDKGSDDYDMLSRQREQLVTSLVTARSQLTTLNSGTMNMKLAMPKLNRGTLDANLYSNAIVYAGQSDAIAFNEKGKMTFGSAYGAGKNDIARFVLDDMGKHSLVTEPMGSKAFVWKLAEKMHVDSTSNKPFNEDWTYTRVFNDLTERGPQNAIGMAFTDMAGDNQTKSFADIWLGGLKDKSYYTNPETGEAIGMDINWMKDVANSDLLKKMLAKYITSVMRDIHGPTINQETGQVKKTQSELAQDLIKKYSK